MQSSGKISDRISAENRHDLKFDMVDIHRREVLRLIFGDVRFFGQYSET